MIHITTAGSHPDKAQTQPSAPSMPTAKSGSSSGFEPAELRTVANDADCSPAALIPTVRPNPLEIDAGTVADGADANLSVQSDAEEPGTWRTVI
jgi:hypothetical protein